MDSERHFRIRLPDVDGRTQSIKNLLLDPAYKCRPSGYTNVHPMPP